MLAVRTGPVVGLLGQVALLAVLAGTTGLGAPALLAALAYALVLAALLTRALRADRPAAVGSGPVGGLGPAGWVTLGRAGLVGGVVALAVESFARAVPVGVLVGLAAVALLLDAVDGWVARRTGTASAFGARFDMEVDAFLILVLSVHVAGSAGGWVLAIGLMRYGYVAASRVLPWLRIPLPPRYWRKVVAAIQGVTLVTAAAGVPYASLAVAAALALLTESFGRDVLWQWHRRARPAPPADRPVSAGDVVPAPRQPPAAEPAPRTGTRAPEGPGAGVGRPGPGPAPSGVPVGGAGTRG